MHAHEADGEVVGVIDDDGLRRSAFAIIAKKQHLRRSNGTAMKPAVFWCGERQA